MSKQKLLYNIVISMVVLIVPLSLFAQVPSSSNFRLDTSDFNYSDGLMSSSSNYSSRAAAGAVEENKNTSSAFHFFSGFFPPSYPGIPGVPTLTNTGGMLYNSLDFIISTGGNRADTNYAIAISSDGFATTKFIQADDTVGDVPAWQTYIAWGGGTGQRVYGLTPNTTYQIKVKARFGPDSETGYSLVAQAATILPTLTVIIEGLPAGTAIGTATTTVSSSPTDIIFNALQPGTIKIAGQRVTVTTNATAGYTTTLSQDHDLASPTGTVIPAVVATNASPAPWPIGVTFGRFGYHTTATALCTGNPTRFALDDTFAAATSTPYEIACNTGPASTERTNLVFKVEVGNVQSAGRYSNLITYITTPQY